MALDRDTCRNCGARGSIIDMTDRKPNGKMLPKADRRGVAVVTYTDATGAEVQYKVRHIRCTACAANDFIQRIFRERLPKKPNPFEPSLTDGARHVVEEVTRGNTS